MPWMRPAVEGAHPEKPQAAKCEPTRRPSSVFISLSWTVVRGPRLPYLVSWLFRPVSDFDIRISDLRLVVPAVLFGRGDHRFDVLGSGFLGEVGRAPENEAAVLSDIFDQLLAVFFHRRRRCDLQHGYRHVAHDAGFVSEHLLRPENVRFGKPDQHASLRELREIMQLLVEARGKQVGPRAEHYADRLVSEIELAIFDWY